MPPRNVTNQSKNKTVEPGTRLDLKFLPPPRKPVRRLQVPGIASSRPVTAEPVAPESPPKVDFYDVINSSYEGNPGTERSLKRLSDAGYVKDAELSSHNQTVLHHPGTNTLLITYAGTHNLSDVGTDTHLLLRGTIKGTKRYEEGKDVYNRAKAKYNPQRTKVAGHSLGGKIARDVAEKNDLVYTYNKANVGDLNLANEMALRSMWDLPSLLGALQKGTRNTAFEVTNPLEAHKSDNLEKRVKEFV
jgi:hypothetical protein